MASKQDHYKCDYAKRCKYGVPLDSSIKYICDYIGMTGKSRIANDPTGEIINGKCGHFEELKNARTKFRAKNRYDNAEKGRYEP